MLMPAKTFVEAEQRWIRRKQHRQSEKVLQKKTENGRTRFGWKNEKRDSERGWTKGEGESVKEGEI